MGIADTDIERIRHEVPIVDVVQQYVQLRRVGRRWSGLCPFHGEKTPSFSVNEELGFFKCFGCGVGGDVITFVREMEHLDFVGAVELLAAKAGITLTASTERQGRERQRKASLVDVLGRAIAFYHQRLLVAPDGRPARDYLRSRGITGEVARQFQLGWAPEAWDDLARHLRVPDDVLRDSGLGYLGRTGRQVDAFRARVLFPIFDERGDPVALGGRVLPGADGPKYKNSPETPVYSKSRTLYGLNWAKADIVRSEQVIVCEGYTDVIGFHRAGVPRAVATCGTALTEEHVRMMKRFASTIVLAFDADEAGQGAADRFYAWEKAYDVSVRVAALPKGKDPGDLASSDPAALVAAVAGALPFLAFRIERLLAAADVATAEGRARAATRAVELVNEHPNVLVRRDYAGQIAARLGRPVDELVGLVERGGRPPELRPVVERPRSKDNAEIKAVWLLVHRWTEAAPWFTEALFTDPVALDAVRSLGEAGGDVRAAVDLAGPEGAELLLRLAVEENDDADPFGEAVNLLAAATRREVAHLHAKRDVSLTPVAREGQLLLDELGSEHTARDAAARLLGWLEGRIEVVR